MDRWIGWHFVADHGRLAHTGEVVEAGKTYRVDGPLELCSRGLHASRRALDALRYAPGAIVCRVELRGERLDGDDKACARERRVLWMADSTRTLHEFALVCAEDALGLVAARGEAVDPRSHAALVVKRRWLDGRATDAELAAAWDAARAAAWDAAGAAAWAAAEAAARAAAWDAGAAAWAAARDAQNDALEMMLTALGVGRRG